METKLGIELALEKFEDSPTRLAVAIGGGVTRQNVEHWLKSKRVPSDHCPAIEAATNGMVRCEDLRPDVAWGVLRGNTAQAPASIAQAAIKTVAGVANV